MDENTNQTTPPVDNIPTPVAQPSAPAPQQQVVTQYVVSEKSLNGIGGWLVFWMILFSLGGISYITAFASSISIGGTSASAIITDIFAPILTVGFIASVTYIAMQKKLARLVTLATLGASALYAAINTIVNQTSSSEVLVAGIVAGVLIVLVVHGLIGLYFILSKRVNQTLVK